MTSTTAPSRRPTRRPRRTATLAAGLGVAAGTIAFTAGPASAATSVDHYTCDGQDVGILTHEPPAEHTSGWGAGHLVDGGSGTLIPTSFSRTVRDASKQDQDLVPVHLAVKGGGNANHHQDAVTCSQVFTSTLGELLQLWGPAPGDLPDWADEADTIVVTFTVTAIPKR
jgi:hypothetical protein